MNPVRSIAGQIDDLRHLIAELSAANAPERP